MSHCESCEAEREDLPMLYTCTVCEKHVCTRCCEHRTILLPRTDSSHNVEYCGTCLNCAKLEYYYLSPAARIFYKLYNGFSDLYVYVSSGSHALK